MQVLRELMTWQSHWRMSEWRRYSWLFTKTDIHAMFQERGFVRRT